MRFNNQDRSYPVGAQFIGAPPIYRPMAHRCPPQADKSAVRAYMRRLQLFHTSLLNARIGQMGIIYYSRAKLYMPCY